MGRLYPTTDAGLRLTRQRLLEYKSELWLRIKYEKKSCHSHAHKSSNEKLLWSCNNNFFSHFSEGRRGSIFHWSSSLSYCSLFIILFFSSGGMKFSIIKFLHKYQTVFGIEFVRFSQSKSLKINVDLIHLQMGNRVICVKDCECGLCLSCRIAVYLF